MSGLSKSASAGSCVVGYSDPRTAAFRRTLDRLPDEIALAIGLRVFHEYDGAACVCGWAIRETIARETNVDPDLVNAPTTPSGWRYTVTEELGRRFGGTDSEWNAIFGGVCNPSEASRIEEALFDRVMAASLVSSQTKKERGAGRGGSRVKRGRGT